ncbi:hypothetical protein [Caudoviricetes sp.]|nr:hypothetical protein [Caudoviricetes sp.]UOF81532.1 hypothetical protein [Caudoviricetes sp.]
MSLYGFRLGKAVPSHIKPHQNAVAGDDMVD